MCKLVAMYYGCPVIDIGGETDKDVYSDFAASLTILTTVLNDQYEGVSRPMPVLRLAPLTDPGLELREKRE
ncbi:MAG: hypothetical protein Ct9H300mP22_6700 [Gammaproteobacteria bacterium]|nr:MAG: hypothetical protein Ct9H300mP22_6700 [Gammaproteobacteria bacterium]